MKSSTFARIASEYARRSGKTKHLIPLHLGLIVVSSLLTAGPPLVIGKVVDMLIKGDGAGIAAPWLLAAILGATVLFFLTGAIQAYIGSVIVETASTTFQFELYQHIQKLSADFYQQTRVGEITSRLTNDINSGVKPFYGTITGGFGSLVFIGSACAALCFADWRLFALFVSLCAINFVYGNVFVPRVRQRFRDLRDKYGDVNAQIVERVNGHSLIRAFAREKTVEEEMRRQIVDLRDRNFKTQHFFFRFMIASLSFNWIVSPFALLIIGSLFVGNGVTVGNLVTAFTYWSMISLQMHGLVFSITSMFTAIASISRILEFFDQTPLVRDRPGAAALAISRGALAFENVGFCYPGSSDDFALHNVSFTMGAHQKTAIVGSSGSGKSTLANLILRSYDVASGRITIDGQDIAGVTQHSLRSRIGIVMQETILLDGTFRTNLAFVKDDTTEADMLQALERAELREFVTGLPQGLDTVVGEKGIRLSGGQRQRLSIARVFLLEPPIVIFDEATSALDAVTERSIMGTMQELLRNRTAVVIAHRISTVMDADQIIALDKGRVAAAGTHRELYRDSEFYRRICIEQRIEEPV